MDIPPTERQASQAHQTLMHRFQAADAEDPWLQREWAETKAAIGAMPEAALHMQASPSSGHAVHPRPQLQSTLRSFTLSHTAGI